MGRQGGIRHSPVAHTLSGKGAIACTHPLSAGIFGRYSRIANDLIETADCILVVGCKLGEIATKRYTVPPPGKTLIHLDIAPDEIGRCYPATVALWGDARAGLEDLLAAMPAEALQPRAIRAGYAGEIAARMAHWEQSVAARLAADEVPINMARLLAELNRALPANGILVADGGFAAHWGGLLFDSSGPAAASCRIAASLRSATACRARSARSWAPRIARSRRSPATAAST